MKMKFLIMLAPIFSGSAWAADFEDTAKVISSTPIYERIAEPKQECWNETVSPVGYTASAAPVENHSMGGAIVGGLVGGLAGHQVGKGSGNTAATLAGTIAGALVGERIANNPQGPVSQTPHAREERHCRQVENYRDVIRGYNVIYRYNGQDITTRMPFQPGDAVRVAVSVLPNPIPPSAPAPSNYPPPPPHPPSGNYR